MANTVTIAAANAATQAEVRNLTPMAANAIIRGDGTDYTAYRALDGTIISTGTNASTVIQAALDGLTALRTAREKVVLYGDFTLPTVLDIPNLTIVELIGEITTTGEIAVYDVIGKSQIDFVHGTYTLSMASSTPSNNVFRINTASSFITIDRVVTEGGAGHAVNIKGNSTSIIVTNSVFNNYGDDGISFVECTHGYFDRNICSNGRSITGGSSGIEIEDGADGTITTNNICFGNDRGIQLVVDPSLFAGTTNSITTGNHCYNNVNAGIILQYAGTTSEPPERNLIANNLCENNGAGISILSSNNCIVSGNIIAGTTLAAGRGINVGSSSKNVSIFGNTVSNCRGNGIDIAGDGLSASFNVISNCGLDGTSNQKYGVRAAPSNRNCKITNNTLSDDQTVKTMGGIQSFDSTNLVIENNFFDGLNDTESNGRAIVILSANGLVTVRNNTNTAGDAVTFITDFDVRTTSLASPVTIAHGLTADGLTGSAAVVFVSAMASGVTDLYATMNSTNITITYTGSASKIAYQAYRHEFGA